MAPRTRRISCNEGLVHFYIGVSEQHVQEFLKTNKIERVKGSPEWMTTESFTTIQVPPADSYIVPDDVWIWVKVDLCK